MLHLNSYGCIDLYLGHFAAALPVQEDLLQKVNLTIESLEFSEQDGLHEIGAQ